MIAFDGAWRIGFLILVLLAGCETSVCGCPPVDSSAHLIVRGVVQDPSGAPIQGTEVSPAGVLQFDCAVDTNTLAADPTPAVSTADGRFRFLLFTGDGPGVHCFDLLVSIPSTGLVDTIQVQGAFVPISEPPDSVSIQVTIEGEAS